MDSGNIRDNEREIDTEDTGVHGEEMNTGSVSVIREDVDVGDTSNSHKEIDARDTSDSHKIDCETAAVEHKWEVVIQLLCLGVIPAEWIIRELFGNMTPQLLSRFSPGKLHISVIGPLLLSAVHFGMGDLLLQILEHEMVPDRQLMDIIMLIVNLRQADLLLQLFRWHSRTHCVFREFFPDELRSDDEETYWIFSSLHDGLVLYNGEYAEVSQKFFFRIGVQHFIKTSNEPDFIEFCSKYLSNADIESSHQLKDDWQFVCMEARTVKKYKSIGNIMMLSWSKNSSNNAVMMTIALKVIFGSSDVVTVSILQEVCYVHTVFDKESDRVVVLVLDQLLTAEQWHKHAPAVNEWFSDNDFQSLPCGLLPDFVSMPRTDYVSINVSRKAKWCMRKSYYNLVFVLAFSIQNWNMLEDVLTVQHYKPPFGLRRCIEKVADLGLFSIAVRLLRYCLLDDFPSPSCMISEEIRKQLTDKCVEVGLFRWAVHFTIPDWNRIQSLIQTNHHPDALNYALIKAVDNRVWDFFENYVHRCTDPDGVMNHILSLYDFSLHWNYIEKLMDMCIDFRILATLLKAAALAGKLEIVRSVVSKVSLKAVRRDFPQWSCILSELLKGMAVRNTPDMLGVLNMLVHAGVSTVNRSDAFRSFDFLRTTLLASLPPATMEITAVATQLVIQSGAISYRALDQLRHNSELEQKFKTANRIWKQCYTDIVDAAATPCTLQHLARLVVSDAIGCHPDRSSMIQALPIPERLKDAVKFKDVTDKFKA